MGIWLLVSLLFFFFNDTASTEIYTLSLHDALPICRHHVLGRHAAPARRLEAEPPGTARSEEHTSELQSRPHLVCRLLLEKKKIKKDANFIVSINAKVFFLINNNSTNQISRDALHSS